MNEDLKTGNRVIGIKQSLKVVSREKTKVVYIAKDAEKHIVKELEELCRQKLVEIQYISTMKQLGESCGIEVGAAAAAIIE